MKYIRVGAGVLNQTPLDWNGNKARILAAIEDARKQGVSILCLPEMSICGYNCEDAFHSPRPAPDLVGSLAGNSAAYQRADRFTRAPDSAPQRHL